MEQKKQPDPVICNLEDAGCNCDFIERFMELQSAEQIEAQLRMLAKQRCRLLECIHESQKKLDCLDYLIYQLKNRKKSLK